MKTCRLFLQVFWDVMSCSWVSDKITSSKTRIFGSTVVRTSNLNFASLLIQLPFICYSTFLQFIEYPVLFPWKKMSEETKIPFPHVTHWSQHHCRQLLFVFPTSWLSSSRDMQSRPDLQSKLCRFEHGMKLSTMAGFEGINCNCNEQD
jgi:hypothetical protein